MELPPYNHEWRERKDKYQSGTEDNSWWYLYRKYMKEQGIIEELKFNVNFDLTQ